MKRIYAVQKTVITVDGFFNRAKSLRTEFEARFKNPHEAGADRFVWDWWHVPGQYTLLRTPAYHFFSKSLYRSLHEELVKWGRENLGCHDISPPWLSCYVDGCRQELHADLPHGPWAFVFSLTPWKTRKFTGGETVLLREETLRYWEEFESARSIERGEIVKEVEPRFNRLTVFDPRIPHGVNRVEGVLDPREGRLVVHGWFVQPRPYIQGILKTSDLEKVIGQVSQSLGILFRSGISIQGLLSMRFSVGKSGNVKDLKVLSNSIRPSKGSPPETISLILTEVKKVLIEAKFPRKSSESTVTLPLVFESS